MLASFGRLSIMSLLSGNCARLCDRGRIVYHFIARGGCISILCDRGRTVYYFTAVGRLLSGGCCRAAVQVSCVIGGALSIISLLSERLCKYPA